MWYCIYLLTEVKLTKILSSHPEVFCIVRVLEIFAKFTKRHLRRSLFLDKVTGWRHGNLATCNFIKKRLWHSRFLVNLQNIENAFLYWTCPVATSEISKSNLSSFYTAKKLFQTFSRRAILKAEACLEPSRPSIKNFNR